jgi:hypothetical protein
MSDYVITIKRANRTPVTETVACCSADDAWEYAFNKYGHNVGISIKLYTEDARV